MIEGRLSGSKTFNKEFIKKIMYFDPRLTIKYKNKLIKGEEYIITSDNILKMFLIFMKMQYNLPIVIQADTGCGKTAMVNFLVTKILN